MRILINSLYFFPDLTGIGKYTGEMAEWLAESGHEVRVVTGPPFYPQWQIAEGFSGVNYRKEQVEIHSHSSGAAGGSLLVYRCPVWVPRKPSGLKRLFHLASFAIASFPVMVAQILWKPDVVLVVEPPLFCGPQAYLVARFSGAKAWMHIQDFEVDAAFDLGIIRTNWLRRSVLMAESFLLQRFDLVSTISLNMRDKLIEKKLAKERTSIFPNWVDCDEIYPLSRISEYRSELGVADTICVALYSGNMGEKQGLELLVEAARREEGNVEVLFILCGEGSARSRLMLQAQGLTNIKWLPLQPTERLNELLNLADIHLLPQRAGVGDLVMPSKLLGMLASGRPVIAMAEKNTQLENEIRNSCCGEVVNPGDIEELVDKVEVLVSSPGERKRMGDAARIASSKWTKNSVLSSFEVDLENL